MAYQQLYDRDSCSYYYLEEENNGLETSLSLIVVVGTPVDWKDSFSKLKSYYLESYSSIILIGSLEKWKYYARKDKVGNQVEI